MIGCHKSCVLRLEPFDDLTSVMLSSVDLATSWMDGCCPGLSSSLKKRGLGFDELLYSWFVPSLRKGRGHGSRVFWGVKLDRSREPEELSRPSSTPTPKS